MKTPFSTEIDYALKVGAALIKVGTLLGGVCIVIYSLRIGRLPQGLSLGDGILFLMVATCFGICLLFFVASLTSLGIFVSPGIHLVLWLWHKYVPRYRKGADELKRSLAPFSWASAIPGLCGVFFIGLMSRRDPAVPWTLSVLALALYFFYSWARMAVAELVANKRRLAGAIEVAGHRDVLPSGRITHFKIMLTVCILMAALMPLLLGGVSGQLLDGAMRLARVRIEGAVVHIKPPYASLLPANLQQHGMAAPLGYVSFTHVVLLWTGFGTNTVVQFQDGLRTRVLDIPNSTIIVERL